MKTEHRIPEKVFTTHSKEIEGILRRAVQKALLEHKRVDHSIVVWKDGKVVILQPDEILVEEPLED